MTKLTGRFTLAEGLVRQSQTERSHNEYYLRVAVLKFKIHKTLAYDLLLLGVGRGWHNEHQGSGPRRYFLELAGRKVIHQHKHAVPGPNAPRFQRSGFEVDDAAFRTCAQNTK